MHWEQSVVKRIKLHRYTGGILHSEDPDYDYEPFWVNVDHIQAHEDNAIWLSGNSILVKESLEELDRLICNKKKKES